MDERYLSVLCADTTIVRGRCDEVDGGGGRGGCGKITKFTYSTLYTL